MARSRIEDGPGRAGTEYCVAVSFQSVTTSARAATDRIRHCKTARDTSLLKLIIGFLLQVVRLLSLLLRMKETSPRAGLRVLLLQFPQQPGTRETPVAPDGGDGNIEGFGGL